MWVWIIVAVVVVALAVWAFWPRRRGITDADVRRSLRKTQADLDEFRRPDTSGGIGMK
jgi:hypothetical protein